MAAEKEKRKAPNSPTEEIMPSLAPISRTIVPTTERPTHFRAMLQGMATNRFTQLSTRSSSVTVDEATGMATLQKGTMTVFIEKFNTLSGELRVSTHKLLDACTIVLTEQNAFRSNGPLHTMVSIPIEDYMAQCGIPLTKASKDKTRRKVKEDLEVLYNVSLNWSESVGREGVRNYAKMRLISSHAIIGGKISVRFSEDFARYITHSYIMQYSIELLRLDERNPSAYHFGRKLLQHYSNNNNKARGSNTMLSVRSLLESTPEIPSYEEVMCKGRQLEQRIIRPFENALNGLGGLLRWEYSNAKKIPLTQVQRENFTYDIFIKCYILFEPADSAQIDARIE